MENLDNDMQISALVISEDLSTRDVTAQDINVDGVSVKGRLRAIDEIYGKRVVLRIGDAEYMFFGKEIGG